MKSAVCLPAPVMSKDILMSVGRKKKCAKQVQNSDLQEAVLVKKPFVRVWLELGIWKEWLPSEPEQQPCSPTVLRVTLSF